MEIDHPGSEGPMLRPQKSMQRCDPAMNDCRHLANSLMPIYRLEQRDIASSMMYRLLEMSREWVRIGSVTSEAGAGRDRARVISLMKPDIMTLHTLQ